MGPQAEWEAPAPPAPRAVPEGWGCWSGRHYTPVGRGSLSQFRSWDPSPAGPGWGEPTKLLCSCPGTNGLEAAGSAVSRRHQRPRGSGRGKGDRWSTDRWRQCRDPFLCQPGACGTSSPSWGPAPTAHTVPAPWMHQSALEMLTQHLGHSSGVSNLWRCLQGMASWKSRSCSRLPSWKKPPWLAGKRVAGSGQPPFIPTLWNSQFC